MRLKTKLVLSATTVTLFVVLLLTGLFIAELLRQRIEQTATSNQILANAIRSAARHALVTGLSREPSADPSEAELMKAVADVLRGDEALRAEMASIVRYSLTVQDVSITDVRGIVLTSTDPDTLNQPSAGRTDLRQIAMHGVLYQWRQVFGPPRVFDLGSALDRNGRPFLVIHVGVRSTFLKASFAPGLRDALLFALPATMVLVVGAGALTNLALRPLETINAQLELLTAGAEDEGPVPLDAAGQRDTIVRVAKTIDRLERKMRRKETSYTALQTNMEQMLDTLRDGVLLFAADRSTGDLRSVMVSDAVALFLRPLGDNVVPEPQGELVGRRIEEIFAPESALGSAVLAAFESPKEPGVHSVVLEDGRQVQISVDRIPDGQTPGSDIGIMLTLRDIDSAKQVEQELEVSRRLAAIGKITAGVGHEVKNPINAMVLHLELLRGKLASVGEAGQGAQRHVEILASEMQRLDRVVQTLADFSRPMELRLRVVDLRDVVASVIELTWEQMKENNVSVKAEATRGPLLVHVDSDLIRQAILNLVLNGMQAMPEGGVVNLSLRREQQAAVIEVRDKGTGIEAELMPRIFELYFTTKKTGSGIGLATTYRILQMHGGALEVQSTAEMESANRGSVFTVRLPISLPGSNMRVDTDNKNGFAARGLRT